MATRFRREIEVVVGGFVRKPGPIKCFKGETVEKAVMQAGGANEFASLKRVRLLRNGRMLMLDLTTERGRNEKILKDDMIDVGQKCLLGM